MNDNLTFSDNRRKDLKVEDNRVKLPNAAAGVAKNTAGTVVATVPAGGEAEVADSAITVNGAALESLPATKPFDVQVEYQTLGVVPTTIVGSKAIIPDSPPTPPVTIEHSLRFDGVNDFAIGTAPIQSASDFSISFWFKLGSTVGRQELMAFSKVHFGAQSFGISYESDKLEFPAWSSEWNANRHLVWAGDTNWHQLTVTVNNAVELEMFIDDVSIGTYSGYNTIFYFDVLYLGRGHDTRSKFGDVYLADFRIFNRVLNTAEVTTLQTLGSPIGDELFWLPFSEDEGTTQGYITDVAGGQKMILRGMASGYGINTNTP